MQNLKKTKVCKRLGHIKTKILFAQTIPDKKHMEQNGEF